MLARDLGSADFLLFALTALGHESDFGGCSHSCTFGSAWAEEWSVVLCRGRAGHQRPLSLHCMPAPGWEMLIKATWGLHKAGPGTGCEARLAGPAGRPKSFESWGWRPVVSKLGWMLWPWKWPRVAVGWDLGLLRCAGVQ